MSINYIVNPATSLNGKVRVPGDKSISHRSVMLGSIANGSTRVSGFLSGADAIATMNAFRAMGVDIEHQGEALLIKGVGRNGLQKPDSRIDLGNSGTAMRLMMGLLAGQSFNVELTGDASLCSRPMKRISDPLSLMGAKFITLKGCAPLTIDNACKTTQTLNPIDYSLPMASAQVKSAVLLAGLYSNGQVNVFEPAPTRDHTERMLRGFGYDVLIDGNHISLKGGGELTACDIDVPADISSAAFFIVGAAISPNSALLLEHVGVNPTRTGVIKILRKMGANIEIKNEREVGGEPVADILVNGGQLHGIDIPTDWVPLAIDEIPVLSIAAACATGITRLSGAEELRVKESDRITAVVDMLVEMGVNASEAPDGFIIEGRGDVSNKNPHVFSGGVVQSHDDHRISMAASVASLRSGSRITIQDCDNVVTSFPGYKELANKIGLQVSE